jgi:transposase-like protein
LSFEQARRLRRKQVTTDAHSIFEAPTQTEALERLATFQTRWGQLESEVVRLLAKDIELSLTFYPHMYALAALA